MKNKLLSISAILTLSITNVFAANLLNLNTGIEQQQISGYVKNGDTTNYFNNSSAENDGNNNTGNFGLKDKYNFFVSVDLRNTLPFFPNISVKYTRYYSRGHSNYIAGNVSLFDGTSIPIALTDSDTELNINSYDITGYYNLNFDLINFKIGAGVDLWKGNFKIYDNKTNTEVLNTNFNETLPYLYGHFLTTDFKGLSLSETIKWAEKDGNYHHEYSTALKYNFNSNIIENSYIKIGYKIKDVKGTDGDNIIKLKYKGAFVSLGISF